MVGILCSNRWILNLTLGLASIYLLETGQKVRTNIRHRIFVQNPDIGKKPNNIRNGPVSNIYVDFTQGIFCKKSLWALQCSV
jgi:hypothetical protein